MNTKSISPKEELQTIRDIMERSSKFLSLSGLSGVFAGVCALLGVTVAYYIFHNAGNLQYEEFLQGFDGPSAGNVGLYLAIDALVVLVTATLGAIYFSKRKAKQVNQSFWNVSSRRLFWHLMIPMVTGGIFAILLILRNNIELIASVTLIFYGLSLVNAGKFTFGEIHYMGLTQIILGILAGIFINFGLLIWALGFGVMHIVYGIVMYYKYER